MTSGPILLLGANGQVGGETLPLLRALGSSLRSLESVVSLTRADLDLSNAESIRDTVRAIRPRWIVNAAAYTGVDKAESDPATAFAINGDAPGVLGEEARKIGAPVIHFSTEYVFSGAGDCAWVEGDPTGPLGVYGASKLAGERALSESGAAHFIFRTSWVFGSKGTNFLLRILQLALERDELRVVDDQHGSPTWARTLAELVAHCMLRAEADAQRLEVNVEEAVRQLEGVYHACSSGATTWFGFASEFLRIARAERPEQKFARLSPIPSSEFPTPAERPLNSRMSCEKLSRELRFVMPTWQDATKRVMDEVLTGGRG